MRRFGSKVAHGCPLYVAARLDRFPAPCPPLPGARSGHGAGDGRGPGREVKLCGSLERTFNLVWTLEPGSSFSLPSEDFRNVAVFKIWPKIQGVGPRGVTPVDHSSDACGSQLGARHGARLDFFTHQLLFVVRLD